jgi:hypothetical protein
MKRLSWVKESYEDGHSKNQSLGILSCIPVPIVPMIWIFYFEMMSLIRGRMMQLLVLVLLVGS